MQNVFFSKSSFSVYLNKTRQQEDLQNLWLLVQLFYSIFTVHSPRGLEFNGKSTRVFPYDSMTRKSFYSRLHTENTNDEQRNRNRDHTGKTERHTICKVRARLRCARPQGIFRDPILAELGSRYNDVTR